MLTHSLKPNYVTPLFKSSNKNPRCQYHYIHENVTFQYSTSKNK